MKVTLSGFNVDADVLRDGDTMRYHVPSASPSSGSRRPAVLTPETVTAAYARISHSGETIEALRRASRRSMERARKSNQSIIFEMQHGSVSEHAAFNFDVSGLSRLATEELEHFRLASYTERSQRYVRLADEFVIPEEIRATPYVDEFIRLVEFQNAFYHQLQERLLAHFVEKYPEQADNPDGRTRLETIAKEDARYVTSLATETQLGMTLNSRALRLMLRRFAAHPLTEVRRLGEMLHTEVKPIAPSLFPAYRPNDFDQKTRPALRELAARTMVDTFIFKRRVSSDVELVDYTLNADNKVMAALLHTVSSKSFEECLKKASKMIMNQRKEVFKTACQYMDSHNVPPREFEYVYLTFDVVASAACFAQLKRHRMLTLTCQQYDPGLGVTVPSSIEEIRETTKFHELTGRCQDLYERIKAWGQGPGFGDRGADARLPTAEAQALAAQYALTNAHQRRVLVSFNARELYHLTRLREDKAAQWDIRDKTRKMVELAKHIMPLTLLLTGGKDQYPALYQELFGKPLVIAPPPAELQPEPVSPLKPEGGDTMRHRVPAKRVTRGARRARRVARPRGRRK